MGQAMDSEPLAQPPSRIHAGIKAKFLGDRAEFTHPALSWSLSLEDHGQLLRRRTLPNRIEFDRSTGITEWYEEAGGGWEHGFTVSRPDSKAFLVLNIAVGGPGEPGLDGNDVVLSLGGQRLIRYSGLHSWDATGRNLPSRAEVDGQRIRLIVDVRDARYPITVDPVLSGIIEPPTGSRFGILGTFADQQESRRWFALNGNTMIATAKTLIESQNTSDRSPIVYTRPSPIPTNNWTVQGRLIPNEKPGALYGEHVALDGDIAVVSSKDNPTGVNFYVFERSGTVWTQTAKLPGAKPDGSRASLALSGNTIVLGGGVGGSEVHVYTRGASGWAGPQILNNNGTLFSSLSVAANGDTIAIGDVNAMVAGGGKIVIYTKSNDTWNLQSVIPAPIDPNVNTRGFGYSIALSGNSLIVGAPGTSQGANPTGAVYLYSRSASNWTLTSRHFPSTATSNQRYGISVAIQGSVAAATSLPPAFPQTGSAYLLSQSTAGGPWREAGFFTSPKPGTADFYGEGVQLSAETLVVGAPLLPSNASTTTFGGLLLYPLTGGVKIESIPAGRTFTLSGPSCVTPGTFTTPYSDFFTNCTAEWTTTDTATPGTRYRFQNWSDGDPTNPRNLIVPDLAIVPVTFLGNFRTEYELTTQPTPFSGGTVTGAGFYEAGNTAQVTAIPNPGFVFTGFGGALSGAALPQSVVMSQPRSVSGGFTATPPALLSAVVSAKTGISASRTWNISLTNNGPGIAFSAQIFALTFTQSFGAACSALPVRLSPAALPGFLGTIAPGATIVLPATIDFTGCPTAARFTVGLGYMANGGSSGGMIQLSNQFQ
jgi:hypothetical protein